MPTFLLSPAPTFHRPRRTLSALRTLTAAAVLAALTLGTSAGQTIPVEIFDPGYLEGDSNYHSITAASDGKIYFSINSHHPFSSVKLFRFDPADESIAEVADVTAALGIDVKKEIPHGKIHTPLIEHDGYLYFATHTSQYDGNLPMIAPADGRLPYQGGHFMRYDLRAGTLEDLADLRLPNEGIITMAMDPASETLYGLTWPTGLLISYNLGERLLHNWGAVQERGEWGQLPEEWDFICRDLGIDPDGRLFGSTDGGRIWRFDRGKQRPVTYLDPLSLDDVPPVQEADFRYANEPHFFWRNWRTIRWNESTKSFWGLHGGSTQLFEFIPDAGVLRSVASMRVRGSDADDPDHADGLSADAGRRSPHRTQLGFLVGPDNVLYYLGHGAPIARAGGRNVATSVHLMTYSIDDGVVTDHGALVSADGRRVFFTESLELGADGHLYTVAWVETTDPDRMKVVQAARGLAVPEETADVVYEIQLVRLGALTK